MILGCGWSYLELKKNGHLHPSPGVSSMNPQFLSYSYIYTCYDLHLIFNNYDDTVDPNKMQMSVEIGLTCTFYCPTFYPTGNMSTVTTLQG